MDNGDATYSKTPFKGSKHPRGKGGKFHDKGKTEEESVSYHHKFSDKGHPRGSDGTFRNMSAGCKLGLEREEWEEIAMQACQSRSGT